MFEKDEWQFKSENVKESTANPAVIDWLNSWEAQVNNFPLNDDQKPIFSIITVIITVYIYVNDYIFNVNFS